jgi:hypothetical protein
MKPDTAPAPAIHDNARGLWFALLAPPSAWAIQEMLGWFFGERTCGQMTPPSVRWVLLGISVLAFLVALAGVGRGWSRWRGRTEARDILDTDARDRIEFMALGGFLISSVFAIAIFWAGLSTAFLVDCGRMR